MSPIAATLQTLSQAAAKLAMSGDEALVAKAGETAAAGIFPLKVALVVLVTLTVTGSLLVYREARHERRHLS